MKLLAFAWLTHERMRVRRLVYGTGALHEVLQTESSMVLGRYEFAILWESLKIC